MLRRDHRARARLRLRRDRGDRRPPATAATSSTGARSSSATATSPTSASSSPPSTPAPGRRGITAFVVEQGDEGFVRGPRLPKMGSRCFPAAELAFEDCFVPDDRRLGEEGAGFRGLMCVFDVARVQLAASAVGLGRAALEHAVEYAKDARGVRARDPRVPGRLVPPRRREAEARPGAPPDAPRRRARRRGRTVLDRGRDGEARGIRGVDLRDVRRRADARRRRLHPRLARRRSGTATRSSTRSGTGRATSCGS